MNAVQIISLSLMLAPNTYNLQTRCIALDKLVGSTDLITWTCWNTLFAVFVFNARILGFWRRKGTFLSKSMRADTIAASYLQTLSTAREVVWTGCLSKSCEAAFFLK